MARLARQVLADPARRELVHRDAERPLRQVAVLRHAPDGRRVLELLRFPLRPRDNQIRLHAEMLGRDLEDLQVSVLHASREPLDALRRHARPRRGAEGPVRILPPSVVPREQIRPPRHLRTRGPPVLRGSGPRAERPEDVDRRGDDRVLGRLAEPLLPLLDEVGQRFERPARAPRHLAISPDHDGPPWTWRARRKTRRRRRTP